MGSDQSVLGGRHTALEALVEAAEQRDWLALPTGVLRHIFRLASTWQTPGSSLAAPVCSSWGAAAAEEGSSSRLLYHVGRAAADQSFAAWLGRNCRSLEALTLTSSDSGGLILTALAEAAAAAQAAGRPLRLRTLRVLTGYVDLGTAGQLVACLPHLRCLQLGIDVPRPAYFNTLSHADIAAAGSAAVLEPLAPWQRATQLEELYLGQDGPGHASVAELLPLSLRRLSWDPWKGDPCHAADMSHLTRLTTLQLRGWVWDWFTSSQLPLGLQRLEVVTPSESCLDEEDGLSEILNEQPQLVTTSDCGYLGVREPQLLSGMTNLRAVALDAGELFSATREALKQLPHLSALTLGKVWYREDTQRHSGGHETSVNLRRMVATAASMSSLRRLHLRYLLLHPPLALGGLTQVTQLRVSLQKWEGTSAEQQQQQQRAWGKVLGRMVGLRWLSVPDVLLSASQAWLGGLQQLRVLVVFWTGAHGSSMPWAEGCSREVLPPRLQVLAVYGMTAEQAASWQVRRRLQRLLGSSGCEVLVGVGVDQVADFTGQMEGLPAALQQALG